LDRETCEAILNRLIADNFLRQTAGGAYVAFPTPSAQLKATLTRY